MFANRRKARRVGGGNDEPDSGDAGNEPVVRRPSSKPKQNSKLRLSFGPGGTSMVDDVNEESEVVIPKKRLGARSRLLDQTAQQRPRISALSDNLPVRVAQDDTRPSYSQEYLKELRISTPTTPRQMRSGPASEDEQEKALDITSKFGELAAISGPSAIPSEAEIREKKERRARLAKEQDYISLNDVEDEREDDDWAVSKKEQVMESRLVPDDEDFAEGFDEYVEDGRIALGRKAELEQKKKRQAEMKELIEEAEESSNEDDSEAERRADYEAAQTRAGMDGLSKKHLQEPSRPKTPPKISSIPRLAACLTKLQASLATMEASKRQLVQRLEQLRQEKVDISVREVEIQKLLKEAGDNYERLCAEAGVERETQKLLPGADMQGHRGLENFGASLPSSAPASDGGD